MTLTLDPALEKRIQQELARTGYDDPAKLIAHALDLLEAEPTAAEPLTEEMEDWGLRNKDAINRALDVSFAQASRGEFYTPEQVQARLPNRHPPHLSSRNGHRAA
jgi:predicted transcriptional regulator